MTQILLKVKAGSDREKLVCFLGTHGYTPTAERPFTNRRGVKSRTRGRKRPEDYRERTSYLVVTVNIPRELIPGYCMVLPKRRRRPYRR